jgi:prephenate dehydrogenase
MANHLSAHVTLCIRDTAANIISLENGGAAPSASLAEIGACDYIILAVPVSEIANVCHDLSPHVRPDCTVLDVGSVKLAPAKAMRDALPPHVDIVGTHPLFGPQSADGDLKDLKIAICPVRGSAHLRIAAFLKTAFGLQVILTTADAHDREAATVQGLTHLIAKVLMEMQPLPTNLSTKSYDLLLQAINMVKDDAPSVLDAIERANPYSMAVREEFFTRAAEVRGRFE